VSKNDIKLTSIYKQFKVDKDVVQYMLVYVGLIVSKCLSEQVVALANKRGDFRMLNLYF